MARQRELAFAGGLALAAWVVWRERRRRRRGQVVIIGDAFVDVLVCGLSELPRWNSDVLASMPVRLQAGGSALNSAVHSADLLAGRGKRVSLHTAVAKDDFGRYLEAAATRRGVDLVAASDVAGGTGACAVLSGAADRAFVTHRGVVDSMRAASLRVDDALLKASGGGHVHVAGYFNCGALQADVPRVFRAARAAGIPSSLGCQFDATGEWRGIGTDLVGDSAPEYLILSEEEASAIAAKFRRVGDGDGDGDDDAAARRLLEIGAARRCVVVTLGPRGALATLRRRTEIVTLRQRSACVPRVVDATGAGDAFVAGFLVGLPDVAEGLLLGCACGSACVSVVGASAPLGAAVARIAAALRSESDP